MKNLNACRAVVIVTNLLMAAGGIVMYLYLPQDADGMLLGISVAMAVLPLVAIAVFLPLFFRACFPHPVPIFYQ